MSLVSIVIPSYNNSRDIVATVNSVLNQTYDNIEIIISDHSSTDGTRDLLEQFVEDSRVRLVTLNSGGGAPANWNYVSELANGRYIKLVCGDDILDPDCVNKQVAAIESDSSFVMVASPRRIIDENNDIIFAKRGLSGLEGKIPGMVAVADCIKAGSNIFGEPASVLFTKTAWQTVGGWDGQFPYLLDQTTYSKILTQGDFFALNEVLSSFRVSSTQWSYRLANSQAKTARAFHKWFASSYPGSVSISQRVLGDVRAVINSYGRRVVYFWLQNRSKR